MTAGAAGMARGRRRCRGALVLAAALVATACSGAAPPPDSPAVPATTAPDPAPAATPPPTAAAATLPPPPPTTTSLPPATTAAPTTTTTQPAEPSPAMTGAAVLAADDFAMLREKRVGVIANHTSQVGGRRLIDLLADHPEVTLVAVLAPEHGVAGTLQAGELVGDASDAATAIPVYSLYGDTRKPTAAMLAGLDVLVFDLQDVGARFYTYISTMGLAMQAAAEAGLPFVVLDRPNPLGGRDVAGFVRDAGQESFISQYPIPSVYGMTAGELARAIAGEGWLPGVGGVELSVVQMSGWSRGDRWPATGLDWVAPSPGLPTFDSAIAYPVTVLFEATTLSFGKGTGEPFTPI